MRVDAATNTPVDRYFASIRAALSGLDVYLRDDRSPLYRHGLVAQIVTEYVNRLATSFDCWRHHLSYAGTFRISRAESGFPVFRNVLELENDRRTAKARLSAILDPETLRGEMADFILRHKAFPKDLKRSMAERLYLEAVQEGHVFSPFVLPETVKVSVNPKTMRPYYMTHWGAFDGASNLPVVYSVVVEDSSPELVKLLVTREGKLDPSVDVPLPVGGLLNADLAKDFDAFAERNSAYSLTPSTIATNMDRDFDHLHPKQLRRIVLGPFYSAGITEHNDRVNAILENVGDPANGWLLTWTIQDISSQSEKPGRNGLWSSEPAREVYHIATEDLEAARMGVSAYEKHALIPHEAYQALYAAGEIDKIFAGYRTHIISGGQVISDV